MTTTVDRLLLAVALWESYARSQEQACASRVVEHFLGMSDKKQGAFLDHADALIEAHGPKMADDRPSEVIIREDRDLGIEKEAERSE